MAKVKVDINDYVSNQPSQVIVFNSTSVPGFLATTFDAQAHCIKSSAKTGVLTLR